MLFGNASSFVGFIFGIKTGHYGACSHSILRLSQYLSEHIYIRPEVSSYKKIHFGWKSYFDLLSLLWKCSYELRQSEFCYSLNFFSIILIKVKP